MSDFILGDMFFTPLKYNDYDLFISSMVNKCESTKDDFSILKLAVTNSDLIDMYKTKVNEHNNNFKNKLFMDSGFDLFIPEDYVFENNNSKMSSHYLELGVKAELVQCTFDKENVNTVCSAFYLYPRSSISKTPLMLANHTGIIDSGYRGNLIVALRCFGEEAYTLQAKSRIVQICDPKLKPIYVILVDESELSTTERGKGGFGSTGI